ncbi:hypothetical protein [Pseudomonas aeruginosa]|uniref:hypothetical protein n=1 Tax=Pseudomonas aeruginosa TaxID=287 RepID=UPI001782696E|nr:hypothetical protein [Pseudomonas aeruginosa]
MSSTQHQLIEQCATRLRGIVEALDNIHDTSPHRWSTDLDDVHSSAESLLALIKDQAPTQAAQGLAGAALAQPSPAHAEQAEAERPTYECTMGVGGGDGNLFVHGDHASIKAAQKIVMERDAALARVAELEALMQMNFGELHTARNLLSRLSVSGVNVDAILGGQLQDLVIVPADATLEMVEALKRSLTVTNRGTLLNAGHALNASIAASPFAKKAPEPVMCPRCEGEGTLRTGIDESPSTICKRCDGVGTIAAAPGKEVPQAWLDVQAERRRQVEAEGWTPEHDDEHDSGELAAAGAAYALHAADHLNPYSQGDGGDEAPSCWPWHDGIAGRGEGPEKSEPAWWKPSTARRDLVKACALALAEIERLDRACISQSPQPGATTASS